MSIRHLNERMEALQRDDDLEALDEKCGLPRKWRQATPGACWGRLRAWCGMHMLNRVDGVLRNKDGLAIESLAGWRGPKCKFFDALVEIGFLQPTPLGYKIRNWETEQPHLVSANESAEQRRIAGQISAAKRRSAALAELKSAEAALNFEAKPSENDSVSIENREKTVEKIKPAPVISGAPPQSSPGLQSQVFSDLEAEIMRRNRCDIRPQTNLHVEQVVSPLPTLPTVPALTAVRLKEPPDLTQPGKQLFLPGVAMLKLRAVGRSVSLSKKPQKTRDHFVDRDNEARWFLERRWAVMSMVLVGLGLDEMSAERIVATQQQSSAINPDGTPYEEQWRWPIANLIEAIERAPGKKPVNDVVAYVNGCKKKPKEIYLRRADGMQRLAGAELDRAERTA